MERLTIFIGQPNKSLTPTNYFFLVPLVGRFVPLVSAIRRPVESLLEAKIPQADESQRREAQNGRLVELRKRN